MWAKHLESQNGECCVLNAHNKDRIKELLNRVRARIREIKTVQTNYTATVLLIGIPNVGKSAIANSMHQIGRVSAQEKGKLKHAIVSPQPGETKEISSFKIASHPSIYVLDTPGILSHKIEIDSCSKLALTGAIEDSLVGEIELAHYLLEVINSEKGYKHWENLLNEETDESKLVHNLKISSDSTGNQRKRRQYSSDHTQDFVVREVRKTLCRIMSSFEGNIGCGESRFLELVECTLAALREAFRVSADQKSEEAELVVSRKLLNLYRIGRLGHYTLDPLPEGITN